MGKWGQWSMCYITTVILTYTYRYKGFRGISCVLGFVTLTQTGTRGLGLQSFVKAAL